MRVSGMLKFWGIAIALLASSSIAQEASADSVTIDTPDPAEAYAGTQFSVGGYANYFPNGADNVYIRIYDRDDFDTDNGQPLPNTTPLGSASVSVGPDASPERWDEEMLAPQMESPAALQRACIIYVELRKGTTVRATTTKNFKSKGTP